MERSSSTWLAVCTMLLLVIVGLLAANTYSHQQEQQRRQKVLKTLIELETKRIEVLSDYAKNLESYQTKSVYHQMYHANNAQLLMMNLMVQQDQLLAALIAGKE